MYKILYKPYFVYIIKFNTSRSALVHEVFGDTKKLLTQEFVRQGYLEYTRQPNSDPPMYDFRWGQRAKVEISKRSCLNFVSQVRIIKH
jgi:hypothetical protein